MDLFDPALAKDSFGTLLQGLQVTIEMTFIVICLCLVLGIVVALGRLSRHWVVRIVTASYVEFIRSTPLLLQLIYIYFVLPFLGQHWGMSFLQLDPFVAGILGLTINYTAYMSEVYRAGIQAIPKGQLDAAAALGMRAFTTTRRVVLPQAIRIVIPALGNYFISLFKDTSITSVITIQELMFSGQIIAARTYNYFTVYTMIFALYFAVGFPATRLVAYLERSSKRGYSWKRRRAAAVAPGPRIDEVARQ
jgi:His/Glu/Gln/Arg/opine family amino acid ABC transporter permease subunit